MQPPGGRRGSIQFVRSPTEKALSILLDTQTFIGDAVQYQVSHGCKNLAVIAPPEFRGGGFVPALLRSAVSYFQKRRDSGRLLTDLTVIPSVFECASPSSVQPRRGPRSHAIAAEIMAR